MSKFLQSTFMATALALTACAVSPPDSVAQTRATVISQPLNIELKSGQVLQFALIRERKTDAAKAIRDRYFQTAVPHAASLGDQYLGNLRIKQTLVGKNDLQAIALWAFPDVASQDEFRASPKWPEYVQMRKDGWEELHVYSVVVPEDMTLNFDPDKNYTLAAAWAEPNMMDEYDRYLDGIEADFDQIGAKYAGRFTRVDLQSNVESVANPTHFTLVEWSEGMNVDKLRETNAYQQNSDLFQAALSRFDLYWVHFPIPPRGVAR